MAEPPRPPPKKYSLFTVALVMKTLTKNALLIPAHVLTKVVIANSGLEMT